MFNDEAGALSILWSRRSGSPDSDQSTLVDTYGDQFAAPFAFYNEDDVVLDYSDDPDSSFAELTDATVQYQRSDTAEPFDAIVSYASSATDESVFAAVPDLIDTSRLLDTGGDVIVADPHVADDELSDYLASTIGHSGYTTYFNDTRQKGDVIWFQGYSGTSEAIPGKQEIVYQYLNEHDGRVKQKELCDAVEWPKSTVSRVLIGMDENGDINKYQIGRENLITLPGHEPDAIGAPEDWPEDSNA